MKVPTSLIDTATQTKNGLMSKTDKVKLDGLGSKATQSTDGLMSKEDKKKLDGISSSGSYLPLSGGTLTGALTIKASSRSNNKINIGDGDYIHFAETDDDHLEIKSTYLDFAISGSSKNAIVNKITLNKEEFPFCRNVNLGNNNNLNNIKTSGIYGVNASTNSPSVGIAILEVYAYQSDWLLQRYTSLDGGSQYNGTWERYYCFGAWTEWKKRW